ncbi:MAG: oligosaccharide flippase family protein [Gammaproteobacteria bacterium]|nr:oligosaccharide flippase family protein [Gammaproteobacteria bacterium]
MKILIRRAAVIVGGTGVAQLISLGVLPLLLRVYTPAEFGVFALFSAAAWMSAVLATWQLEHRVILQGTDDLARQLVQIIFAWSFVFSVLVAAVFMILAAVSVVPVPRELLATRLGGLFFLTVAGISWTQALRAWLVRVGHFSRVARGAILQSVTNATVAIAPALIFGRGYREYGLLVAQASGLLITALVWIWSSRLTHLCNPVGLRWSSLKEVFQREAGVGFLLTVSNAVKTAYGRLPTVIVTAVGGPVSAGYFGLVERVVGAPSGVIGQAICTAFRNQAGVFVMQRERAKIINLYWLIVKRALAFAVPVYLMMAFSAPAIFTVVFGETWRLAGEYAFILLFGEIFVFALATVEDAAVLLDLNRYRLCWHLGQLLMMSVLWWTSVAGWLAEVRVVLWIFVGIRMLFALIDLGVIMMVTARTRLVRVESARGPE